MTVLPNALALGTISGQISGSPHNSNNGAIQTAVNALLGILDGGTTGEFLTGNGSSLSFILPPGYQWDRKTRTTNATTTATTEGASTTIITGNSVTYDGTEVKVEAWFPRVGESSSGGSTITLVVYCDTNVVGQSVINLNTTGNDDYPVKIELFDTPAAGAHVYKVFAFVSTGTATFYAGLGGSGNLLPAWLRVTKA